MQQLFDAVVARIMLYCLRHYDGCKYQRISREMGFSDGVVHKFTAGTPGSELFIKCVGDYFNDYSSAYSKSLVEIVKSNPALFGNLLFTSVRDPEFVRTIGFISEIAGSDSVGIEQRKLCGGSKVLKHKSHNVVNDANEARVSKESQAI